LGIQQLGLGADSLPPSSAEVKDECSSTCSMYLHDAGWGKFTVTSCTDIDVN